MGEGVHCLDICSIILTVLRFFRELLAAVRYTLNSLQNDVLYRKNWMWLIPVLQIVNGSANFSERGLNYDSTKWWGVQQLKSAIDSHRRNHPTM